MAILNNKKEQVSPESFKASIEQQKETIRPETSQLEAASKSEQAIPKEVVAPDALEQTEDETSQLSKAQPTATPVQPQKSENFKLIEHILEQDLSDMYMAMDDEHKEMFKFSGEQAANKINDLLAEAKSKAQEIFEIIKAWLKIIPGVNKWFIIQESKIKTDKIMRLKDKS